MRVLRWRSVSLKSSANEIALAHWPHHGLLLVIIGHYLSIFGNAAGMPIL